jgi:hypothetical protein
MAAASALSRVRTHTFVEFSWVFETVFSVAHAVCIENHVFELNACSYGDSLQFVTVWRGAASLIRMMPMLHRQRRASERYKHFTRKRRP